MPIHPLIREAQELLALVPETPEQVAAQALCLDQLCHVFGSARAALLAVLQASSDA